MISRFTVPTRVVAGLGSTSTIGAELRGLGATVVAVVADQGLHEAGLLDEILATAGDIRLGSRVLVPVNPGTSVVEDAIPDARAAGCEAVLAIGGGSALGAAKAVAIRLTNHAHIGSFEGSGLVLVRPAPTIAVPTTAGSGSEVSNALVLHDPGREREIVIRGEGCEPRVAILDGTVLRGLPRPPMMFAGLDALTHALEVLWATGAGPFSDALARDAAEVILETLPIALEGAPGASEANRSGANDVTLQRLLEASCQANMACGNSGLALVHALSSAPAVLLPHGLQNGVLLPHVAAFNSEVLDARGLTLIDRLADLYAAIAFEPRFAPGVADADAMIAASTGHPFRNNNARSSTDDELREILADAGAFSATRSTV